MDWRDSGQEDMSLSMVDKDVTISQLVLEIDLLRSHVFGLEQTNAQLQSQIRQLEADNRQLEDQIARLKQDSSNSSEPPSSDIVKPNKSGTPQGRHKRTIGGQQGHPRHERLPFASEDVDRTVRHELSATQSNGLIPLEDRRDRRVGLLLGLPQSRIAVPTIVQSPTQTSQSFSSGAGLGSKLGCWARDVLVSQAAAIKTISAFMGVLLYWAGRIGSCLSPQRRLHGRTQRRPEPNSVPKKSLSFQCGRSGVMATA